MKKTIPFLFLVFIGINCKNSNENDSSHVIAKMDYRFDGCFGGGSSSLSVYTLDKKIFAKLNWENAKVTKTQLTKFQFQEFEKFAKELENIESGGFCTTVEYYSLDFNGKKIIREDGGCSWRGFLNLRKSLFPNDSTYFY